MLGAGPVFYLTTLTCVLIGLSWCRKYWDNRSHPPLPPGPPSLPIVGSIFSLHNPTQPWLGFNAWKSTYGRYSFSGNLLIIACFPGDIIYARLLNKPVVVINSEEVANDLLVLRSAIYSDRPQSIVFEFFGPDFMAFMAYGDRWRLHRRIFHQSFRLAAISTYHTTLRRSAHKMLFGFLQNPTDYTSHFQMLFATVHLVSS
ncbi:cytochrome P450 [Rhizopogon vinicolor AM-OR11-026]|uniref:Cytochrome P450 n=1 Tax=Rhizopogon vinicolor AM-OR11-026 TaxID=1314800 RepID=A0A1B7ME68_9AGAM|nr:cytochrome P450 [Rhizopogon vinicolor AM-OR11-026]